MSSSTRIFAAILGFSLLSAHTFGQEQPSPVQRLIQQYESMSDYEQFVFLQAIVLIGMQKNSSIQLSTKPKIQTIPQAVNNPPKAPTTDSISPVPIVPKFYSVPHLTPEDQAPVISETLDRPSPVLPPSTDKSQTTVQITLPQPVEPQPNTDIQLAFAPPPAKLLDMPQPTSKERLTSKSVELGTDTATASIAAAKPIVVVASQNMVYGFSGHRDPKESVFALLLPEYQQKLKNGGVKIEVDDLRKETTNFYVSTLETKISGCGYQVLKSDDTDFAQGLPLQLETGIQRIVINKTLFETALIGEANAKITSNKQELSSIETRSTEALTQFQNSEQRFGELKKRLSQMIEKLSNQIADKICSLKVS